LITFLSYLINQFSNGILKPIVRRSALPDWTERPEMSLGIAIGSLF
jgi:hypothetical protein